MRPDDFPILLEHAKSRDNFAWAIATLDAVSRLAPGDPMPITKQDLQGAGLFLNRAVERAWQKTVMEPIFQQGGRRELAEPLRELAHCLVLGLYDLGNFSRKLARSRAEDGTERQAMQRLVTEAMPLVTAMSQARQVAKAAPRRQAPPKPVNPDKIVKTCGCCSRSIAVVPDGTMAHHGYQRPGTGWQTASCPGIRFKPLEISNAGPLHMLRATQDRITHLVDTRRRLPEMTSIQSHRGGRTIILRRAEVAPEVWSSALAALDGQLRRELQMLRHHDIPELTARLRSWRPADPAVAEDVVPAELRRQIEDGSLCHAWSQVDDPPPLSRRPPPQREQTSPTAPAPEA